MNLDQLLTRIRSLQEGLLNEREGRARVTLPDDDQPATHAASRQHFKQDKKQEIKARKRGVGKRPQIQKPEEISISQRTAKYGHKFANRGTFKKTPGGALQTDPALRNRIAKNQFVVADKKHRAYPVIPAANERARAAGALRQAQRRGGYDEVKSRVKRSAEVLNMHRTDGKAAVLGHRDKRPHGDGGPPPSKSPTGRGKPRFKIKGADKDK